MKKNHLVLSKVGLFAFILSISWAQPIVAAPSGGGSSGVSGLHISIPVRFGIIGGYQSATNSFDADKKNYSLTAVAAGADFNFPIKPLHALLGVTGWISFPKSKSGETDTFYLAGPYLGYLGDNFEFFVGGGAGSLSNKVENSSLLTKTELSIAMGCGFVGVRAYLGKDAILGIGANGYYCKASSYDQIVTTSGTPVTTHKASSAMAAGGLVYLIISWGEERTIH